MPLSREPALTPSALLLLATCTLCCFAWPAPAEEIRDTELEAIAYLAQDRQLGSYLERYPGQRTAFGLPDEPLSAVRQRNVAYPDLEKAILSEILDVPVDFVVEYALRDFAKPASFAADWAQRQQDFHTGPYDGATQSNMLSVLIQGGFALSNSAQMSLIGALISKQIDTAVVIGEMTRARVLQNRALSLLPASLVNLPGSVDYMQERVSSKSGAFLLLGRNLSAQGGWEIDHSDGVHSRSYARYDVFNHYVPGVGMVSTAGSPPRMLPMTERSVSASPLDPILNTIGRSSKWIGRNVTGGNPNNTEVDEWGYFTLGNTTIAGVNLYDNYARLHDIEYYVSTHFPEGTEVKVPGPAGDEYFISEGSPTRANLRVIGKVVSSMSFVGLIHALATRDYEGRREPVGKHPVKLLDKTSMIAPTYNTATRRDYLARTPGGAFREMSVHVDRGGVTVTTRSQEKYHITYNGAAESAAIAEYNRTGVYDIAKHYRNAQPSSAPATSTVPPMNTPPTPPIVGGVRLEPHNVYSITAAGIDRSKAEHLGTAARASAGDAPVQTITVDGKTYVIARAKAHDACKPQPTISPQAPLIGRFSFSQTDLQFESPTGARLTLTRFFNSDHPSGKFWGWQPYELTIVRSNTVILVDRQASRNTEYQRTRAGSWRGIGAGIPELREVSGNYRVDFAHGYSAEFSSDGKLLWTGAAQIPSDRVVHIYESRGNREIRRELPGSLQIKFDYDAHGRLISAIASGEQKVAYDRHPDGRLRRAESATLGRFEYGYDELGRVTTVHAAPNTQAVFKNAYDAAGRLTSHAAGGTQWRFSYRTIAGGGLQVDVEAADADRMSYLFDSQQRLTAYGDFASRITLLNYDGNGHLAQVASGRFTRQPAPCVEPELTVSRIAVPLDPSTTSAARTDDE